MTDRKQLGLVTIEQRVDQGSDDESSLVYRTFFEDAPIGKYMAALDGRLLRVNTAFCSMLSYPKDDLHQRTLADIVHRDDRADIEALVRNLDAGNGECGSLQARHITRDGAIVWTEIAVRLLRLPDGAAPRVLAHVQDLRAHKLAEEALQERVKELACQNDVSTLLRGTRNLAAGSTRSTVFQAIVERLPAAWQYPEVTHAHLVLDGQTYACCQVTPSRWLQTSPITVDGATRGELRIFYSEQRPPLDEGPFLAEERNLIESLTRMLAEAIERSENHARYVDLFENAPDMYASIDIRSGLVSKCNRTLIEKTGFAEHELVGHPIGALYTPQSTEAARRALAELVASGEVKNVELQLRCKDGSTMDVRSSMRASLDEMGNVTQCQSSWRDISVPTRLRRELAAGEENYRLLFETMPVAWAEHRMCFDDSGKPTDFTFLRVNHSFERFLDTTAETVVNRRATEVFPSIRNADPDLIALYGEVVRTGVKRRFDVFFPPRARWFAVTAFRRDADHLVALFEDVTQQKQSETKLQEVNVQLARSNRDLEQFAYVASHDLQEPLRMVASYTQLLARRYRDRLDADAHEFIDFAVDGARRMQTLINDLLTFSRVQTRGVEPVPTDVTQAIDQALLFLKPRLDESEAEVVVGDMPQVMADCSQLAQVFQNLVGNAIKYRSIETPRVQISAHRLADSWELCVADNGIGIDPQYHDRIFVIFQRLHERGRFEGSGIGLAIVKRIIERHGGEVHVESSPDRGARFFFTLKAPPKKTPEVVEVAAAC